MIRKYENRGVLNASLTKHADAEHNIIKMPGFVRCAGKYPTRVIATKNMEGLRTLVQALLICMADESGGPAAMSIACASEKSDKRLVSGASEIFPRKDIS